MNSALLCGMNPASKCRVRDKPVPGCTAQGSDAPEKGKPCIIVRGKGGPIMEWEELIKKFNVLADFFARQYGHMPYQVKKKCGGEIVIPMVLEDYERRKFFVKIIVGANNNVISVREARDSNSTLTSLELHLTPLKVLNEDKLPDSYVDFTFKVQNMLKFCHRYRNQTYTNFDQDFAQNALNRAYYDLRQAVERYFRRASQKASKEQWEHWLMKTLNSRKDERLLGIIRLCKESRKTVGNSKTIANIRCKAEEALGRDDSFVYRPESGITITLPSE